MKFVKASSETEQKPIYAEYAVSGWLRPPLIFLFAILLGIELNLLWPFRYVPSTFRLLGPLVVLCAVLLFLFSVQKFRAAVTPVRGIERTSTIVRTGPYRFSRNPIYLSHILLILGLSVWLNDLWLLVTLVPAVVFIAVVVIPREESFLDRNFNDQYSSYKATVRRWL